MPYAFFINCFQATSKTSIGLQCAQWRTESFSFWGPSHFGACGFVLNPHDLALEMIQMLRPSTYSKFPGLFGELCAIHLPVLR